MANRLYRSRVSAARRQWIEQHATAGADLPVWSSRQGWVQSIREWVLTEHFRRACASVQVSIAGATVLAIAAAWAKSADHATGRNAAVTRAWIAAAVGCNPKTITRAWKVLEAAGFAVEIYHGHGSAETPGHGKRPSIWHLVSRTADAREDVENVPLPPIGGCSSESPVGTYSPSKRERSPEKNISPRKTGRRLRATPRPLAVQRLAAQFVARSRGLGHVHIGAICDAITDSGIDPAIWDAERLQEALEADMRKMGWHWPDEITNPAGFLRARLRRIAAPREQPCPVPEELVAPRCPSPVQAQSPARRSPMPNAAQRARIAGIRDEIGEVFAAQAARRAAAPPAKLELHVRSAVGYRRPPTSDGAAQVCAGCGCRDAVRRPFLPEHRADLCTECWQR
ncbi:hypothetical protein BKG82_26260 [Mycobacteroides chelonae]|uniref:Replication protein n=1 Tax=Mycobacteroides chelonae TaxID=1774 RepID=A0A1S1LBZ5_MYCCH|nr:hypothetical protein [Mycobacteroides chelonae]OHU47163.1 hypothetical protein BKG82_26260 [Mycobacteroides chelonae]